MPVPKVYIVFFQDLEWESGRRDVHAVFDNEEAAATLVRKMNENDRLGSYSWEERHVFKRP